MTDFSRSGFAGDLTEATRRAFFDLLRRIVGVEDRATALETYHDERSVPNYNPADDTALYFTVRSLAAERATIVISPNTSGAGGCVVFVRPDTGQTTILSSQGPVAAVANTALTGTSGTDGNLTVSCTEVGGEPRVYIENRTGAARGYAASVLCGVNFYVASDWIEV